MSVSLIPICKLDFSSCAIGPVFTNAVTFSNRKLFMSGFFDLIRQLKDGENGEDDENEEVDKWLQNTKLLSLWPPEQFYDVFNS